MSNTDNDWKQFLVAKSIAKNKLQSKWAYIIEVDLMDSVTHLGETGRVLTKLLIKEANNHNAKIKAKTTKIDNFTYRNNWYKSKLLKGYSIPHEKIRQLIKNHPKAGWYDIFLKLI